MNKRQRKKRDKKDMDELMYQIQIDEIIKELQLKMEKDKERFKQIYPEDFDITEKLINELINSNG